MLKSNLIRFVAVAAFVFLLPLPSLFMNSTHSEKKLAVSIPVAYAGLFGFDSWGDMFDGGGAGGSGDSYCACSNEEYQANGGTGGGGGDSDDLLDAGDVGHFGADGRFRSADMGSAYDMGLDAMSQVNAHNQANMAAQAFTELNPGSTYEPVVYELRGAVSGVSYGYIGFSREANLQVSGDNSGDGRPPQLLVNERDQACLIVANPSLIEVGSKSTLQFKTRATVPIGSTSGLGVWRGDSGDWTLTANGEAVPLPSNSKTLEVSPVEDTLYKLSTTFSQRMCSGDDCNDIDRWQRVTKSCTTNVKATTTPLSIIPEEDPVPTLAVDIADMRVVVGQTINSVPYSVINSGETVFPNGFTYAFNFANTPALDGSGSETLALAADSGITNFSLDTNWVAPQTPGQLTYQVCINADTITPVCDRATITVVQSALVPNLDALSVFVGQSISSIPFTVVNNSDVAVSDGFTYDFNFQNTSSIDVTGTEATGIPVGTSNYGFSVSTNWTAPLTPGVLWMEICVNTTISTPACDRAPITVLAGELVPDISALSVNTGQLVNSIPYSLVNNSANSISDYTYDFNFQNTTSIDESGARSLLTAIPPNTTRTGLTVPTNWRAPLAAGQLWMEICVNSAVSRPACDRELITVNANNNDPNGDPEDDPNGDPEDDPNGDPNDNTVDISADPLLIRNGGSTTVSWTLNGATNCSFTGPTAFTAAPAPNPTTDGTKTVSLSNTTTFTLDCDEDSDSVTVRVLPTLYET